MKVTPAMIGAAHDVTTYVCPVCAASLEAAE